MAHVRKLGPRKYQARYRDLDGRERARNFTRATDAEAWVTSIENAKLEGSYLDPKAGRVRLAEWAQRWLEGVRPALKPKTVTTYESLIRSRILPTFGARQLRSVQHSDVQAWVARMEGDGLSASRIRQATVVLQMMFEAAERDRMIGRNPARGVRRPTLPSEEARFFDPATVERIATVAPAPYDLMVRLMGQVGPRFGEVAALRRRSFEDLRGWLEIRESLAELPRQTLAGEKREPLLFGPTKTHATRRIPLPPTLAAAMREHVSANVALDPKPSCSMHLRAARFAIRTSRPACGSQRSPMPGPPGRASTCSGTRPRPR
jgi:integrase